ncbi:hypothetical protein LWI28_021503 [Acer negundo]|uniref:Cytochrome P450 n=1 Tax=Acer negundo TaxID=4023 RepID=A0AAD5NTS3_ACENE|nr:hypothetical protein LWI28_021503 [Acer negundo]
MKERFRYLAANIMMRMIASKRYFCNDDGDREEEESRRFQKAIGDFFCQMGLFYVSNTVPFLGWLDVVKGYTSKMKKTARELDYVLGNWVDKHHQRRLNRDTSDHEEKDFIHVLLSAMDDDKISAHQDANTTINAICLLYCDPNIWVNPSEFIPERFIIDQPNLDIRGLHFECLPFGSGRKKYLGISPAFQVLHLTLAMLLHMFELGTVSETAVDMSEGPGLTVPKATPLEIVITPKAAFHVI